MDEFWNDRISSIKCRDGCVLYAYADRNLWTYNNSYTVMRGDVSNLQRYNDWISRVEVVCR